MLLSEDTPRSPVASGDIVAGKYRVDRVLGAGGMGVVVAATHTELDQRVALKFVLPHMVQGQVSVERFIREARSTVKLTNEHITRVHDVGRLENGAPYIVMELLEGSDLSQLRKRMGRLSYPDAVEYVMQACEGLVEAHAVGIVHRDLKPQNLFVTRRMNGAPLVKILDFGISKATGAAAVGQMNLTDSATVLGSPLYMSPEQMRSARNVDARSDIWALGVILYELLTGKVPFDGETVTELCLKVVIEKETRVNELRDDMPPALADIVHRCLAKEPNERYTSVAALADALEPFARSSEKGMQMRSWRSFSDTADASGPSELAAARDAIALAESGGTIPKVELEKSSTQSTWGNTQSGQRRRRNLTVVGAAGAFALVAAVAMLAVKLGAKAPPSAGISPSENPLPSAVVTALTPAALTASPSTSTSTSAASSAGVAVQGPTAAEVPSSKAQPAVLSSNTGNGIKKPNLVPSVKPTVPAPATASPPATPSVPSSTSKPNGAPILN